MRVSVCLKIFSLESIHLSKKWTVKERDGRTGPIFPGYLLYDEKTSGFCFTTNSLEIKSFRDIVSL